MEALAGWGAAAWAAFSSIGGLPGGVVVKWRSEVAEADGLAFLGFSMGGRGFCVILGDHDRSRYPATHAPCPVEPAVHQPRIPMAARRSTARSPRSGRFRHPESPPSCDGQRNFRLYHPEPPQTRNRWPIAPQKPDSQASPLAPFGEVPGAAVVKRPEAPSSILVASSPLRLARRAPLHRTPANSYALPGGTRVVP